MAWRRVGGTVALCVALGPLGVSAAWAAQGKTPPVSPADQRALVTTYCVTCHNERTKAANMSLERVELTKLSAEGETWEKVIRKLKTGAMPPANAPRPDEARLMGFAQWLEHGLDREAAAAPNPGRTIAHRLNRTEYANVIRDLFALEFDAKGLLPTDNSGFGFDNIGDVLTLSPALLERYLVAAQQIARLAVADDPLPAATFTHRVPFKMLQEDRMSDELPFGSRGGAAFKYHFPSDGEYRIRIKMQRSAMSNGVRGDARLNEVDLRIDGKRVQLFKAGGIVQAAGFFDTPKEVDEGMEVRLPMTAGEHLIAVSFQRSASVAEGVGPSHLPTSSYGFANAANSHLTNGRIEMGLDTVDIEGPFSASAPKDTVSRKKIFACRPNAAAEEAACARRIATTLARRAYRRPPTATEVRTLMAFYDSERKDGGSFDAGIRRVIERMLVSPDFLFRVETDPAGVAKGTPYKVTDLELASRLSFFLWSSIPDDELLNLAVQGRLRAPGVLEQQTRRLLKDPRSRTLVDNFFGQWLFVRNIALARPDPKTYPEFDEGLRKAFQIETELFLDSQIREDHSALDLLRANYTFLNERLARHYDIPNVYGERFRRVALPDDRRAGILGQGTILTATSYANRTSPVKRGQWLLENLLGTPPPAPPANVPPFPENKEGAQAKSVRERMEQHRRNPTCAACHSRIDPLGFALENFNGVGQWRTMEANSAIDASGTLPNGKKFSGPADFRKALLDNSEAFLQTLTQKLMTFGLGRGAEYYDMPAIRKILRDASQSDYRWSALVLGIVQSEPFQMRRAES